MALAGHAVVVEVSTDNATFNEVDGINDCSFSFGRDVLDITDFASTSGAHERMLGLQDCSISISGDYEGGDTNGQNVIRTAFTSGNTIYVGFLWNGSAGHKLPVVVASFEISASVEDKVTFSCELTSAGAFATHS